MMLRRELSGALEKDQKGATTCESQGKVRGSPEDGGHIPSISLSLRVSSSELRNAETKASPGLPNQSPF